MDVILVPTLQILFTLLSLYTNVIIIAIVFSWLISFNVLNTSNRLVYIINDVLQRLTEPGFAFFRRLIPPFGGLDISPIFLLLVVQFFQQVIIRIMMRL